MRSSREEAQDRILHQYDKSNRNNRQPAQKALSLAEQIAQYEHEKQLTPAERLKSLEFSDWEKELHKYLADRRSAANRLRSFIFKNRQKFEDWHASGTEFMHIQKWIEDQPDLL